MFLFEKSTIGAYCNRLYDLEERHGSFSRYGRIKENSVAKDVNATNVDTKESPTDRQTGLPLNSSFFLFMKTTTNCAPPLSLTMFYSALLQLQKLQIVVWEIILPFCILPVLIDRPT